MEHINLNSCLAKGPKHYLISISCTVLILILCVVISPSLAHANIVLKLMGVNPSETQTQKVVFKTYLPKEVETEAVVNADGLEVIYDPQQGSYYVYGEFELAPLETMEKEIELRDVWTIPEAELDLLLAQADEALLKLGRTDYKSRAELLRDGISSKITEIKEKQKIVALNPQKHIFEYRDNQKLLDGIKADTKVLEELVGQIKLVPSITIWKIFLAVTGFLGILALVLYAIWHKQAQAIASNMPAEYKPEDKIINPEDHAAQEEKKIKAEDIEDIIKKEGE